MSNRSKLLLTFQYLQDNTVISGNIDPSVLRPIVLLAQEVNLQELIGEAMFDFLLSARTTTGSWTVDVTGNTVWNQFVEDHLNPTLRQYCVMEFLDSNAVHLSEVGISQNKGTETSEKVDKDELAYQRSQATYKANTYANRLRKFICDDRYWATFSSYYGNSQQNVYPEQRINKGGMWFPKNGTKWNNYNKYDI